MDLRSGARVGGFEIIGPLGAGGMGEVYRALDTRLGREVAIKVLPPALSQDAARRARFDREARLLASLNHPGIGAIYGVEETAGGPLLILELVPGNTLAERIASGPLPIPEALSIARQIAEAVAYAHAAGVVHRDLKPANVKCTPNGKVKVLDFGIAKALSPDSGLYRADVSTVTPGDTAEGAIIGTPDYMSPEQARAQEADRRTDIWSLGCILYEMLTGRRAFQAQTVADTLAAVLSRYPDWSALPDTTPPNVRALLRRCLQRDRDQRVHDMSDVRIEIDDALAMTADAVSPSTDPKSRLSGVELIGLLIIVGCLLLNWLVLSRSLPALVPLFSSYGMALSFPLRMYIGISELVVRAAPLIIAVAILIWFLLRVRSKTVGRQIRTGLILGFALVGAVLTGAGMYFFTQDGLRQAVRMSVVIGAPGQLLQRDLGMLYLAAGEPERVIKMLDGAGLRDDFATTIHFGGPGEAFLLAESYRAANKVDRARHLYQRAQEAAVKFDEELTQRLLSDQIRWQQQFGPEFRTWLPPTSDLRRLPDLIRSVSQQRLDQMAAK